jgi:hypothetical protein
MNSKADVVFTGRIPTAELKQVLGGALALTFVPFFEGFGIPVIEAYGSWNSGDLLQYNLPAGSWGRCRIVCQS